MRHTISTGIVSMLLTGIAWAQVDLNKAQEIELDGLNGLGPTMTRAIMNERQKAPFRDWTDVMQRVKGIKQGTAKKLSAAGLTVNGQSYQEEKPKSK